MPPINESQLPSLKYYMKYKHAPMQNKQTKYASPLWLPMLYVSIRWKMIKRDTQKNKTGTVREKEREREQSARCASQQQKQKKAHLTAGLCVCLRGMLVEL